MPRLTVTTPDGVKQRYNLSLEMNTVTIGRDVACEIRINDPAVSDFHAELRRVPGGFCITDCHSTRGTYIEGVAVECAPLINGQLIQLGDSSMSALFTDDEINFCIAENEAAASKGTTLTPEDILAPPAVVSQGTQATPVQAIPVYESVEPQVAAAPAPAPVAQAVPAHEVTPAPAPQAAGPTPIRRPQAAGTPAAGGAPGGIPGRPGYNSRYPNYAKKSSGNGLFFFMLLLICILAVIAGMTLRHYMETGRLLHEDLFAQEKVEKVEKQEVVNEPQKALPPAKKPVKQAVTTPDEPKEEEKDPMDTAIKSQGKYTLPSADEFIIP